MTGHATPLVLWRPSPQQVADATVTRFAQHWSARSGESFGDYEELWRASTDDVADFWATAADFFDIRWHHLPETVLSGVEMPGARWFDGGSLNYAEHALYPGGVDDDSVAVLALAEDGSSTSLTFAELRTRVGAAQAGLRRLGVGAGDRVAALLPNGIPALVGFLATAALGGVWSSCSPDFGAGAVTDRFAQIEPTVLLAVDGYRYGGRAFSTSATVAQLRSALPSLAAAVHVPELDTPAPDGMVEWAQLTAAGSEPQFTAVPFSAPLWVVYSSGTTGLPKPIVQSVGGILLEHLKCLRLQWDIGAGDRFLWFTTTGWMMWNLLIGGLLAGATVVLYDGSPGYPDLKALWRVVQRDGVTAFGISAAYVTACRKADLDHVGDLSGLRVIGSTGSPLDDAGFDWLAGYVPGVPIVSFSGGTDVCTGIVGGAATVPVWRGEISCRALGARVEAFSPDGEPLIDQVGELVITAPMPSMPVFFWGDHDGRRLRESYFDQFPGVWRHGDWIRITDRGSCVIEGRSDATLNRGGIRMGTAEFYRVVEDLPAVVDSLVVDTSGANGPGDLLLFVVLAGGADTEDVIALLRDTIRRQLSPRHIPDRILAIDAIPRTLSGKKCEVPVKRILNGTPPEQAVAKDALADPDALTALISLVQRVATPG